MSRRETDKELADDNGRTEPRLCRGLRIRKFEASHPSQISVLKLVSRHFCLPLSFHSFVRPAPPVLCFVQCAAQPGARRGMLRDEEKNVVSRDLLSDRRVLTRWTTHDTQHELRLLFAEMLARRGHQRCIGKQEASGTSSRQLGND